MSQVRDSRRIAYVVSRFPKLSETFILREIDALERLGWHVDVFTFAHHKEEVRHPEVERWLRRLDRPDSVMALTKANIDWLRESPVRLLALYVLVIRELWREPRELARGFVALARAGLWARRVQDRSISHVHAHFARHQTVAALAIAYLTGITFSFTGHAQDIYRHPAMLAEKVHRARFVAVVSDLLRDKYVSPLVRTDDLCKVQVVRCGIDTARYKPRLPLDRQGPATIVAVARLIEFKGIAFLVDACRLLLDRGYDLRCHIIGDGPLRDALQQRIDSAGLHDRVALLGPKVQSEVMRALEEAALFVLPSIVAGSGAMEGVPVSLMEAMATEVPVVATSTGAIPELVEDEHTGLLVAPRAAEALADAAERLLTDTALARRLSIAAQQRVATQFDLWGNAAGLHHLLLQATSVPSTNTLAHRKCRNESAA